MASSKLEKSLQCALILIDRPHPGSRYPPASIEIEVSTPWYSVGSPGPSSATLGSEMHRATADRGTHNPEAVQRCEADGLGLQQTVIDGLAL